MATKFRFIEDDCEESDDDGASSNKQQRREEEELVAGVEEEWDNIGGEGDAAAASAPRGRSLLSKTSYSHSHLQPDSPVL